MGTTARRNALPGFARLADLVADAFGKHARELGGVDLGSCQGADRDGVLASSGGGGDVLAERCGWWAVVDSQQAFQCSACLLGECRALLGDVVSVREELLVAERVGELEEVV